MRIHKNIRLLTWFNFLLDFRPYGPIAIIYFTKVAGSFTLGLAVFSVAAIASAAFEVPTGIFSNKIGRKIPIGAAFMRRFGLILRHLEASLQRFF